MEKLNIAEIDNIIWHLRNSMNNGDISKCAGRLEEYIYELTGYEPKPKIVPKFKVGDRVKQISAHTVGRVVKVDDKGYYIDYPKVEGVCYISFILEKDYELLPNKFDITTLKPFDKVLVRDTNGQVWTANLFSHVLDSIPRLPMTFVCVSRCPNQCIPYESNEHLLGTSINCDDYYKTWE